MGEMRREEVGEVHATGKFLICTDWVFEELIPIFDFYGH